jgi:hypothetical protein
MRMKKSTQLKESSLMDRMLCCQGDFCHGTCPDGLPIGGKEDTLKGW